MASKGYISALLNGLTADLRKALNPAFEHVLDTWKLGTADKAANAAWYRFSVTTHATAGEEFSIEHGLNQIPTTLIPILPLDEVGQSLVTLQVSRAADGRRVYLRSSSTGLPITVFLEV